MKPKLFSLLLLAVLCLSGCYPEERFWWSPKGDRAAVVIDNQLHLVNADGESGQPLLSEKAMEHTRLGTLNWLPDGSGFVFLRTRLLKTWTETLALIPAEEATVIDQTLPLVMPLLEAATKLKGSEDAVGQVTSFIARERTKAFGAAVQRKYAEAPAEMEKLFLMLPKGADLVEGMKSDDAGFEINELCVLKLDGAKGGEPRVLARSLHAMVKPKVASSHPVVAFLQSNDDDESASLKVLPLEGGTALTVASQVSASFDWLPESRTLVFMSPLGHPNDKLQSIHRVTVLQESGTLMKPQSEKQADGSMAEVEGPDRMKNPDTLATAVMLERPTLQVLSDGRVLFASQPATLPAISTGAELDPHFYLISADGKSLQPIATAPGDLPANLSSFVASPDGKRIAVVENDTDAVAVVEVATGKTQIISPPHAHWKCRTLLAWKSTTELTFAALQNGVPKWMLWSEDKGMRSISDKWPAESTAEWLAEEKEDAKTEAPKTPATDK